MLQEILALKGTRGHGYKWQHLPPRSAKPSEGEEVFYIYITITRRRGRRRPQAELYVHYTNYKLYVHYTNYILHVSLPFLKSRPQNVMNYTKSRPENVITVVKSRAENVMIYFFCIQVAKWYLLPFNAASVWFSIQSVAVTSPWNRPYVPAYPPVRIQATIKNPQNYWHPLRNIVILHPEKVLLQNNNNQWTIL